MNKAVEIEYPPTPIRPFECLRFNLILNKMPVEMSVFPHKSSSRWEGIFNGIQQSSNNYILKVSENSTRRERL